MKIAFFDTKPYDIPGFEQFSAGTELELKLPAEGTSAVAVAAVMLLPSGD